MYMMSIVTHCTYQLRIVYWLNYGLYIIIHLFLSSNRQDIIRNRDELFLGGAHENLYRHIFIQSRYALSLFPNDSYI